MYLDESAMRDNLNSHAVGMTVATSYSLAQLAHWQSARLVHSLREFDPYLRQFLSFPKKSLTQT